MDRSVPLRLLVIPGLRGSEAAHWQSWLQRQYPDAVRVIQADWSTPDLPAWSGQIARTIEQHDPRTRWIAAAHSFGCLALAHHLAQDWPQPIHGGGVVAALMAAPADPRKFQIEDQLPLHGLGIDAMLVGSEDDPWMPLDRASVWAERWGARFHNLGRAGHINTASGFGPWPWAQIMVDGLMCRAGQAPWAKRVHRPILASLRNA